MQDKPGTAKIQTDPTDLKWIDVHMHIDKLETSPEEALSLAQSVGVDRVITIGTEPADHPVVIDWALKKFPSVSCTLGVHPHEATLWSQAVGDSIRSYLKPNTPTAQVVVAVGEIGLDYYYNQSPKESQLQAFDEQMSLAAELNLPVEIHTREADSDTAEVLRTYQGKVRGLLHCFTSSMELAKVALDCGFDISISGVVTFKNAEELRAVVQWLPIDRLHVETDAPFLAPVPMRGKKNVPEYVIHTAKAVAALKGVSLFELSRATRNNAKRLFPKLVF